MDAETGELAIYVVRTLGFFIRLQPLEDGVRYLIRADMVKETNDVAEAHSFFHQRTVAVPDEIADFAEKRALHLDRLLQESLGIIANAGLPPEISAETEQEYAQTLRLIMAPREDLN